MYHEELKKKGTLSRRILWQLGKLGRLRFWYLASHMNAKVASTLYILVASTISMGILGTAAYFTSWHMIFPPLGPTVFLLFYAPAVAMSCPRNTILGHFMAAAIGWGAHWLMAGYTGCSTSPVGEASIMFIVTVAMALGVCGMAMAATGLVHPPAASTTMIASMGLMNDWHNIPVLIIATALICLQGYIMHRISGVEYPLWAPLDEEHSPVIKTRLGDLSFKEDHGGDIKEIADRLAARQRLGNRKKG